MHVPLYVCQLERAVNNLIHDCVFPAFLISVLELLFGCCARRCFKALIIPVRDYSFMSALYQSGQLQSYRHLFARQIAPKLCIRWTLQ